MKEEEELNILIEFPFMEAFPFNDYEIYIEADEFSLDDIGVDSVNLPSLNLQQPDVVNFQYDSMGNDVIISFHKEDISYIQEKSVEIKKLDSIIKQLDEGLNSDEIKDKIKSIKKGEAFISEVSDAFKESGSTFKSVLDNIMSLNGAEMSHLLVNKIMELNKNIDISKLSMEEIRSLLMYLDFQIHHAKVILGVVIAAKIY